MEVPPFRGRPDLLHQQPALLDSPLPTADLLRIPMDSRLIEIVILEEMEDAGVQAMDEWSGKDKHEQVRQIYMAMRAVYLMSVLPKETAH